MNRLYGTMYTYIPGYGGKGGTYGGNGGNGGRFTNTSTSGNNAHTESQNGRAGTNTSTNAEVPFTLRGYGLGGGTSKSINSIGELLSGGGGV